MSSPPSPVLDLPPIRFMAIASVWCASRLIEPYDIAPVEKRLTIALTGSTSSIGTAGRSGLILSSPRRVIRRSAWLSIRWVYCLKMS